MGIRDKIKNAKETPWMGYYRPKEKTAYKFGIYGGALTIIMCHPRSKWLCLCDDDESVQLWNKNRNVYISIPIEKFEEDWVEWKEKK